ncbi:MAG: hypothetical protein Kow0029_27340 [Candidatus Rifleibacteriota bacterium]
MAVIPVFSQAANVDPEGSIEPPTVYQLSIDGKKFELKRGVETELPIEVKNPKVILDFEPYKEFTYAGIYFKYPVNFSFEAELGDESVKMWNLSGNNSVLMLQRYAMEMDHQTMAQLLVPRYGEENTRVTDCFLQLNGLKVPGTRVIAAFGGSTISQEVYSFRLKNSSILLILQDSLDIDEKPTKEGAELKQLIENTFKITEE